MSTQADTLSRRALEHHYHAQGWTRREAERRVYRMTPAEIRRALPLATRFRLTLSTWRTLWTR